MTQLQKVDTVAVVASNIGINNEMLENFFAFLDVSPKTADTYKRALRQLIKYFSENGITAPTRENLIEFKQSLAARGCSPATIALYLAAAKKLFSWLDTIGRYTNITTGIKAPRQERGHKRDFIGAEQMKRILAGMPRDTFQQKRDYAMLTLMAVAGLRTIEISRANVEDMQTLGGEYILYVQGKGHKDKKDFVKLPAPVLEAINDYLSMRGQVATDAPLFAGIGNRNHEGRLTTRTISITAKNALKAIGMNSKRLTAHSFRHSAATLALLGGESLQQVQSLLRHTSITTTQIYAHNIDRLTSKCENVICSIIFRH